MSKVIITKKLEEEINKKFKGESVKIFDLMRSLEESPHKGKIVGQVSGIVIKEIKYGSFRFYFITDGFKIKLLGKDELENLLIKCNILEMCLHSTKRKKILYHHKILNQLKMA